MEEQAKPELTQFERDLLDSLLDGDQPLSRALRRQLATAVPVSRQLSGVGIFLSFQVPVASGLDPTEPRSFEVGTVRFDLKGVEHGGLAALFVRDGYVSWLEAWTCHGDWPSGPLEYRIHPHEPVDPLRIYNQFKTSREARSS
jgi:hypothetical protein